MYAAVLTNYGSIEWRETPVPEIDNTQVLIQVGYAGICGTDQHIFKGEFHPRTTLPLIPGHEFGGSIATIGREVTRFKVGDRVVVDPLIWCGKCTACMLGQYPACVSLKLLGIDLDGGFGEYVAVDEKMLYLLPVEVSDRHAATVEVFAIGFHACRRAGLQEGDTAVIWGAGKIGQCILQAARVKTKNAIFIVDILKERLRVAEQAVRDVVTIDARSVDPVSTIMERTDGRGVDVAIEAVGHAVEIPGRSHPVMGCIQCIRGAGTVCVLGLADDPAPLFMKELIWKEAKIKASRVTQGEFAEAIQSIAEGDVDPDVIISDEMPAMHASDAFEMLDADPNHYIKVILRLAEE